jgi:hypothetical protein
VACDAHMSLKSRPMLLSKKFPRDLYFLV